MDDSKEGRQEGRKTGRKEGNLGPVGTHAFNPSIPVLGVGDKGKQISVSSRPAWSTKKAPGQPGIHRETLSGVGMDYPLLWMFILVGFGRLLTTEVKESLTLLPVLETSFFLLGRFVQL